MDETYCGKACDNCAHREALDCPGCKAGPGRMWSEECEAAKCCREKGHQDCGTCSFNASCRTLGARDYMPERRLGDRARRAERAERAARRAPFLAKWLRILFWLVIPGMLAGLMADENVAAWFPSLRLPGQILELACSAAYCIILLKLSPENVRYRASGICGLVAWAAGAIMTAVFGASPPSWTLLLTLPAAGVALYGEYQEYMGHAEVTDGADAALSEEWRKLWKWNIYTFAAMFGSVILMLITPILGLLALLAAAIGQAAVGILKLIYLYRSARLFREHSQAGPPQAV